MIKTTLDLLLPSSAIFGDPWYSSENVWKCLQKLGKCLEMFVWPSPQFSKIFGKSSEIFRKFSKMLSQVWLLVDMEFLFLRSTWYLTFSACSLVRYRVEGSKRNSIHCIYTHPYMILYNIISYSFIDQPCRLVPLTHRVLHQNYNSMHVTQ